MTDTVNPNVRAGGRRLLQYREAQKLTQRDVERKTVERYGQENALISQQVSRIEDGKIEKPPMRDLVLLGDLYDLTPNDVAEMYGYWTPRERGRKRQNPRLTHALELYSRLPASQQEKIIAWLEVAVQLALTESMDEDEGANEDTNENEPAASTAHATH